MRQELVIRAPKAGGEKQARQVDSPMARKKRRKKGRLRIILLFLSLPLVVWFLAFLIWFYWYDLRKLMGRDDAPPPRAKPARSIDKEQRREGRPPGKPQEKIFDDDRKKLEDILKRRS